MTWSAPVSTFTSSTIPAGPSFGSVIDFTRVMSSFTAQVTLSGAASVHLEGSFDGTNWYLVTNPVTPAGTGTYLLPPIINPARFIRGAASGPVTVDMQVAATEQTAGIVEG